MILSYDIKRWDGVLLGSLTPKPMIYVKTSIELAEFMRLNPKTWVNIRGSSSSGYDGTHWGIFDRTPFDKPNFDCGTEWVTITLENTPWRGFPSLNGTVLLGQSNVSQTYDAVPVQTPDEDMIEDGVYNDDGCRKQRYGDNSGSRSGCKSGVCKKGLVGPTVISSITIASIILFVLFAFLISR